MKRTGTVGLTEHHEWSTWRDVTVALDDSPTAEFLVRVEARLRHGVGGFESMEFEPGRPTLVLVLNEPRDDADAVTAEIDASISGA